MDAVNGVQANMTYLSKDLDFTMSMMDEIEKDLTRQANEHFNESSRATQMSEK